MISELGLVNGRCDNIGASETKRFLARAVLYHSKIGPDPSGALKVKFLHLEKSLKLLREIQSKGEGKTEITPLIFLDENKKEIYHTTR